MYSLSVFQTFLFSQKPAPSQVTVKNYLSDIRRFISWIETISPSGFDPKSVTSRTIDEYKAAQLAQDSSARSVERYVSSLRKFFTFLEETEAISTNPFELIDRARKQQVTPDPQHLRDFKEFLYKSGVSSQSSKNYVFDLEQFFTWLGAVSGNQDHYDLKERDLLKQINRFVLEEYKSRLISEAKASPNTINRKLSSLRRYILWAQQEELISRFPEQNLPKNVDRVVKEEKDAIAIPINISIEPSDLEITLEEEVSIESPAQKKQYSSFPPLRLLQKSGKLVSILVDSAILIPTVSAIDKISYLAWKAKGSDVFVASKPASLSSKFLGMLEKNELLGRISPKRSDLIENLPKSFYAPLAMSVRHAPIHRKVWHHVRYTRPAWYKRYHSYQFVHYVHAAILVLFMSAAGYGVVQAMADNTKNPITYASIPEGPPRVLSFSGKLTRTDSSPITANTNLRFSIYNDAVASGSSQLWEETQVVSPNSEGNFSAILGQRQPIAQRLFSDNARLYIGMSVEDSSELTPRKEIPTEVLAATSETVQGLRPITDPQAGQKNTLLALDSSGNLSIGGKSNPRFTATGGTFTISGQAVMLTTAGDSSSDIVIAPSGLGKIDIRKPFHNTSNTNTIPGVVGAVEVLDTLAISTIESSQSALVINQNSTGSLISAGVSGIAKFTLANTGAATFGDTITLEGAALGTTQTTFNLLTGNVVNLAIGNSASSLSIGGSGGVTTINNSQTVIAGNLSVNGGTGASFGSNDAGIIFSGQGNHLITASAGSLQLGSVTLTGQTVLNQNVSIVPSGTEGENNLGTLNVPFDTLYVSNIVSPSLSGTTYWQNQTGFLSPNQLGSFGVGGTASSSATWQVFATGPNAGTASSSGNLSFNGSNTQINQLNGGSLSFQTSPGGDVALTNRMTLLSNGNLGIGTSSPQSRLDLYDGIGEALSWVSTSSRRYKNDITAISDPLGKIGRLQGVYYNWDQAHSGRRSLGFIAEDLGQVIPEAVEWEADGVNAKGISYGLLTALAIEGIKAQQEQITTLESMVHDIAFVEDRQFHIIPTDGDSFSLYRDDHETVKTNGAFNKAFIATLETGIQIASVIRTETLEASTAIMTNLTAQVINTDYISTKDMWITGTMRADNGVILSLKTDEITSSDVDPALALSIGRGELIFYGLQGNDRTNVASIDREGNARFSGEVLAATGNFSGLMKTKEALVEGQLQAKKIIADELDLTNEGMMKLISRISLFTPETHLTITNASNIQSFSSNGSPETPAASSSANQPTSVPGSIPTGIEPEIITDYEDFASASASTYLGNLQSPASSGSATLSATQQTVPAGVGMVLADLSVADTIAVSGNFILSQESLDVVGADLQIQPLRSGGVSFLAGLVSIDTAGNVSVSGDLTVKGTIATNVISPIENNDLLVKLGQDVNSGLVVQNGSGEAKLRIENSGSIESDGEGKFSGLLSQSLSIIRGQQVDASPITTIASSSAGTTTIVPGQTQRTIVTPFVKSGSLVYISPASDTYGVVPYIARQTLADHTRNIDASFTIEISQSISKPIKLNWWIVN